MKASILAALLIFAAPLEVLAQPPPACAALETATPIPRDEARLTWTMPTQRTDNAAIPANAVLVVTVYERVGTADTPVCRTSALGTSIKGLAVGAHSWVVDVLETGIGTSAKAGPVSKTIAAPPPTPRAPGNIAVQ